MWNPADNSVKNVTAQLPIEEGDSTGLDYAQLLPIKNGTELLLYGGNLVIMMQYSRSHYDLYDWSFKKTLSKIKRVIHIFIKVISWLINDYAK